MPEKSSVAKTLSSFAAHGVLFVAFIPSKDADGKPLPKGEDQLMWAKAIGDLFAELYDGATQMPPAEGKWYNEKTDKIITEEVILVHSYASSADAEDDKKLTKLARFLHRMGKKLKQGEIAIVIGDVFHRIRKFPLAESHR